MSKNRTPKFVLLLLVILVVPGIACAAPKTLQGKIVWTGEIVLSEPTVVPAGSELLITGTVETVKAIAALCAR